LVRDPTPSLTKTRKLETSKELPPLEELKILQSNDGFNSANENLILGRDLLILFLVKHSFEILVFLKVMPMVSLKYN